MAFLEDDEKQILLDRYFDIEWCDDVSDLRCVHCHRVAINHYVSNCQHLFCRICRKFYNDEEHKLKCPRCQEFITQPDDKDFEVEAKLHQLQIFCPNKKYGCKYKDQLRRIPSHLLTCMDTRKSAHLVKSSVMNTTENVNDRTENNVGERLSQLERKVDDMDSKICVLTESMASVAKEVEGMKWESKICTEELQSINSQLQSINQKLQNNESLHQQTSSNVEEMRIKMCSMTHEMKLLQYKKSDELNLLEGKTYEWTIKDVAKTIFNDEWTFESDVFKFRGYEYDIKAKLEKKEGEIAILLQFKDGDTVNEHLNKNGLTKINYIVRDQQVINNDKEAIGEADLRFYDCYAHPSWIFGLGLASEIFFKPYEKDDSIKIAVLCEPPSNDRSFVSNNGILMWTVDINKMRKQEQIFSPSFYTSPQGYRVKTQLLIPHSLPTSVIIHFLTGEHDDTLPIEFPHKTTVTLINQVKPSKNLVKSEQRRDVHSYLIELGSSNLINENDFIKDDSLLFKVVIEPEASK